MFDTRVFFRRPGALLVALLFALPGGCAPAASDDGVTPQVTATAGSRASSRSGVPTIAAHVFDADGKLVAARTPRVERTDAAWKSLLTPEQYRIVRKAGTEFSFTGALLENKDDGVYTCVACDLPLFDSKSKFESGTGWPSFTREIAEGNVAERPDNLLGMTRVEILCPRCDGHLGHVFDDGPRPTGLRYCVNSESLGFTPRGQVAGLHQADGQRKGNGKSIVSDQTAKAVFAGGCFWCVEAVFEELEGVIDAVSGYAGGDVKRANYRDVCTGTTGHAEVVQITYDPSKIDFATLLEVHFATHDPTQLNRQGNDVGTQYRSAVFYANDVEKELTRAIIEDINDQGVFSRPIVTTLEPLTEFFPAETYHQNYACANPNQGYIRGVALPKVDKVRKKFADRLKAKSPFEK